MFVRIAIFVYISIHALREEGDVVSASSNMSLSQFLSTPSARRATAAALTAKLGFLISIHALREEGDSWHSELPPGDADFYPRPPRGGRRSDGNA